MSTCADCKLKSKNIVKLPFGKLICEQCMDKQCVLDADDEPFTFRATNRNELSSTNDDDENLGIKLYKIKQDLDQFYTDMQQFEPSVTKKIESIKFEININFEYCLNEIGKSRKESLSMLEDYEKDLLSRLKVSKENKKFQNLEHQYMQYSDYFNQLCNKITDLNQCNDANPEQVASIIYQLEENEKYLDIFDKFINDQTVLLNQTYFAHKLLNFTKRKCTTNGSQFGYLKFEDKNQEESKIKIGPYLNKLISNDLNKIDKAKQTCQQVQSINTINEFDLESLIVTTKSANNYKLKVLNIKNGTIRLECLFKDKTLFLLNSNSNHLIICSSNDIFINFNNYELMLYDKQLNLIRQCRKFVVNSIPIDIFIDENKIYILSVVKETNMPTIQIMDLDLNETISFTVKNIDICKNDRSNFKLFTIEDKIFLKQNHLFGTRLNVIDSQSGVCLNKIELSFFLQNNNFVIDKSFKLIAFSSNDYKFLIYDLKSQKILYKISFEDSKRLFNALCLTRDGNIVTLVSTF